MMSTNEVADLDVRYFIYSTFARTAAAPTRGETAAHFKIPISRVEGAFERLAEEHHIALAPGTHNIWMAHPFSGLPTDHVTVAGSKKYWGN